MIPASVKPSLRLLIPSAESEVGQGGGCFLAVSRVEQLHLNRQIMFVRSFAHRQFIRSKFDAHARDQNCLLHQAAIHMKECVLFDFNVQRAIIRTFNGCVMQMYTMVRQMNPATGRPADLQCVSGKYRLLAQRHALRIARHQKQLAGDHRATSRNKWRGRGCPARPASPGSAVRGCKARPASGPCT